MSDLKLRLDQDLKQALLGGNRVLATTLRGLKSVILYEVVAKNARETGLTDDQIILLLSREAKKRQESADLYRQGGDEARANAELTEKQVIEQYLPQQLSDEDLADIIDEVVAGLTVSGPQAIGVAIGAVKERAVGAADGARIAQLVKKRLEQ